MTKIYERTLKEAAFLLQHEALQQDGQVLYLGLDYEDNSSGAVLVMRFEDDRQMLEVLGSLRALLGTGIPSGPEHMRQIQKRRQSVS